MKPQKIDLLLQRLALLGVLGTLCGSVWAASNGCNYTASGTGMGGTGIVAKSTGMGGTGISPGGKMQIAGQVISSLGAVEAQSNGRKRLLAKGDPVCVGETIVTSQSGTLQIRMVDDGLVSVRPETQLKIDQFAYTGTSKDVSVFSLLKGAGRFVTGKLGKMYPQKDLLRTPTATIGVRGTDHEATVILPGDRSSFRAGTYDKVNQGITFIKTEKGEVDIHPKQVGLAVGAEVMPVLLKDIPDFYNDSSFLKEENSVFELERKEEGPGESNKGAQSHEGAGRGAELVSPAETNANTHERPESPLNTDIHESPSLLEMPGRPEVPEMPSLPEVPSVPESPTQEMH
jgi:hypothetical protein